LADEKQLEEHQLRQLNKLLMHPHNNVPYYSRLAAERGLAPHDIWDLDDLEKLPFLTKEKVHYESHQAKWQIQVEGKAIQLLL